MEVNEQPLEAGLMIVDSHHHLWETPPFPDYAPYPVDRFAGDIQASGHNIVASVYNDSLVGYRTHGPEHLRVIGEAESVEATIADYERRIGKFSGFCAAIVGSADLSAGRAVGEVLDGFAAVSPRFRGIRHMTAFADDLPKWGADHPEMMLRPVFEEGLVELSRRNMTFDAWLFQDQLPELVKVAKAVPDLVMVINHLGGPRGTGRYADQQDLAFSRWKSGLAATAACPNIVIKLGGLNIVTTGLVASGSDTATSAQAAELHRRHILTAIDIFGPNRCMFESNAPVDTMAITYGNLWNCFKRITADFSTDDRYRLFAGTAAATYRFSIEPRS